MKNLKNCRVCHGFRFLLKSCLLRKAIQMSSKIKINYSVAASHSVTTGIKHRESVWKRKHKGYKELTAKHTAQRNKTKQKDFK